MNKLVFVGILVAIVVIASLGYLLLWKNDESGTPLETPEIPEMGDWIINNIAAVSNKTIILNGNLIIQDGGDLTLNNVTLIMKNSELHECGWDWEDPGLFIETDSAN